MLDFLMLWRCLLRPRWPVKSWTAQCSCCSVVLSVVNSRGVEVFNGLAEMGPRIILLCLGKVVEVVDYTDNVGFWRQVIFEYLYQLIKLLRLRFIRSKEGC